MSKTGSFIATFMIFLLPVAATSQAQGTSWDGLVEVKAKRLDSAYVRPGTDFRPYRRFLVDPVVVAFRKDWIKRVNVGSRPADRVTQQDAERIAARAREIFAEEFEERFRKAGFQRADEAGPDVLRVRSGVIDLYIAAPDTGRGASSRTYTVESGEATLFLEASDSTTGALLGRALDKRTTRNTGRLRITNRVTNEADFRELFGRWAQLSVQGFEELRALSPVPEDLRPGQRLKP